MKWNVYINHKRGHGQYDTTKHVVEVPGSSHGNNGAVAYVAARHFRVHEDRILALPQPKREARTRAEIVLHFGSGNYRRNTRTGRFTRGR